MTPNIKIHNLGLQIKHLLARNNLKNYLKHLFFSIHEISPFVKDEFNLHANEKDVLSTLT